MIGRKTYRATSEALCPCCLRGIYRGMPIQYVKPLAGMTSHAHLSSTPIHDRCANLYDLEAGS